LHLLDLIAGYDRLFLIDALVSQGGAVGDLKKVEAGEGCLHLFSSHGVGFFEVLELGKRLGLKMPEVVAIYGIEIGDEVAFGREYSPQLIHRIESIVQRIREDIESAASTHRVERSIRPDAVDSELSRDPH
jgi:hydrogenase maturation protease